MGFLDEHLRETNKEAAAVAQDLRRNNHDREMRVATWMLVGNGAALLATFNAAINQQLCDWPTVQPYAAVFLLGLVAAVAHVVFDGEADNRGSSRLTLQMSAARRAAIGIDSNNAFRAWQNENPPNEDLLKQIAENNAVIDDARSLLTTTSEEPLIEKVLRLAARVALGLSALCFGGAMLVALNSGAVQAAACPA